MSTGPAHEFTQGLQQFERSGDAGPLLALFPDDAEIVTLVRTEPARGRDEIEGFWRDYRPRSR